MRGAPGVHLTDPDGRRIIPADAGSTLSLFSWPSVAGDHPRRCGEHKQRTRKGQMEAGSSPQMRGAP